MPSEISELSDGPVTEPSDAPGWKHIQKKETNPLLTLFIISLIAIAFGANHAFAETYVSGTIGIDTTWTAEGSPYIITADVTIAGYSNGPPVLTIEPGVIVKFGTGTGLRVGYSYNGALNAQGTSGAPIIFTSAAETPAAGDWKGIYFTSKTVGDSTILRHCVIEYGGLTNNANIVMNSASPTVENCTIRHSSGNGIYIVNYSEPIIGTEGNGNHIANNATNGILSSGNYPEPTIVGNTLANNGGFAASIWPRLNSVKGNSGEGNGVDAIALQGGSFGQSTVWERNSLSYQVLGDITVAGYSNGPPVLTIEPGVTVKFSQGTMLKLGYSYNGALDAQGTAAAPIVFTSADSTPSPGDWKGINFTYKSVSDLNKMRHCVVEYGGHSDSAGIFVYRSAVIMEFCTIQNNSATGIHYYGTRRSADIFMKYCTVRNNTDGIVLDTDKPANIKYCKFEDNQNTAVKNIKDAYETTATYNWWGAASGPKPSGDGDAISGVAYYSPFAIDPDDLDKDNVWDPFEFDFYAGLEVINTAPDDDHDEMKDDWEYRYGLDLALNDAYLDLDGDGYFNIIEYRYSFNPSIFAEAPDIGVHYEYDALGRITRIYRFR